MDGKIFNRSASSVAITNFVFDLQRFADPTKAFAKHPQDKLYTPEESEGHATQQSGDLFEVSSDGKGTNARYFSNIYAAINYIYDATTASTTTPTTYTWTYGNYVTTGSGAEAVTTQDGYKATIKLLGDVTNGKPFKLGGRLSDSTDKSGKDVNVSDDVKTNLTIDLNNYTYTFADSFELSEANAKLRGLQITKGACDTVSGKSTSQFTIKNGTLTTAAQTASGTGFEQIAKNYSNLTLENVTLDGTNLKGQDGGEDGSVLVNSFGNLELTGSTTIKIQPNSGENIYYALGGKLGGTGNANGPDYSKGFNIKVNLDNDGYIPNIGLYGWVDKNKITDKDDTDAQKAYKFYMGAALNWRGKDYSDRDKFGIDVVKGSVGEITIDGVTVDKEGYTSYSENTPYEIPESLASVISGTASESNISLGANAHSLASFGLFDQVTTAADASTYLIYQKDSTVRPYTLAIEGWNRANIGDDTELNYVASLSGSTQGKGDWLINVKNVSDKADLVLDGTHSLFGIPTSATAELKKTDGSYKLVNVKYNTAKDAVTLTGGDTAKDAFIAPKTAAAATNGILAESIKTIDASDISVAVSLIGNTLANAIYDGKGDNVVSLGSGVDTLIFGGGADSIKDFVSTDFIKLTKNIDPVTDASKVASIGSDLILGFGSSDSINLKGGATAFTGDGNKFLTGVNVEASNGDNYVYTKQSIAYKAKNSSVYGSLTFTSVLASSVASYDASSESTFYTIDAGAVTHSMTLTGEGNDNRLIGSATKGNRLYGKAGNDFLKGSTVTDQGDVFVYSDGNDTVDGFKGGDKASITSAKLDGIASAKLSRNKLVFTVDKNNSLTFNIDGNDSAVEKISLDGGGFLTEAGHADLPESGIKKFRLFAGAKGNIDFANDRVYSGNKISEIDATAGKNSVTLTADSVVSSLALASNKKRDQFVYGGGNITISGFETGKDRINIAEVGPINAFSVGGGDVAISVTAGVTNVISLKGAAGEEVLMHDFGSKGNSYQKFVFAQTGVLYNKAKKPTEATIYQNVDKENPFTAEDSVKKIFLQSGVAGVSIQSADNKATLDASAAGNKDNSVGVSLVGGMKNNKFIGTDYADTFYYYGGKDNITNFSLAKGTTDSIVLSDTSKFDINKAKITLSKKSLKFKFDNKNTLALKSDSAIESLTIGTETYKFAKNAIGDGEGKVSLTSQFSGTYKLADGVTSVDGGAVLKNLTYKGTSAAESLVGGQKKTTFKGNGGNDTLVGGDGKDIFFYAKGDKGDTEIQNFDFGVDKLKIANGTISKISSVSGGGVQFDMTSGKKGDENEIASFNLTSHSNNGIAFTADTASKVVFKANNTHYWFAQNNVTDTVDGVSTTLAKQGELITWDKKVTARDVAALDLDVIDLGYSTNLVKTGVAVKVSSTATNAGLPDKTTTTTTP